MTRAVHGLARPNQKIAKSSGLALDPKRWFRLAQLRAAPHPPAHDVGPTAHSGRDRARRETPALHRECGHQVSEAAGLTTLPRSREIGDRAAQLPAGDLEELLRLDIRPLQAAGPPLLVHHREKGRRNELPVGLSTPPRQPAGHLGPPPRLRHALERPHVRAPRRPHALAVDRQHRLRVDQR